MPVNAYGHGAISIALPAMIAITTLARRVGRRISGLTQLVKSPLSDWRYGFFRTATTCDSLLLVVVRLDHIAAVVVLFDDPVNSRSSPAAQRHSAGFSLRQPA